MKKKYRQGKGNTTSIVCDTDEDSVTVCVGLSQSDANFIIKACNNHYALLEALKTVLNYSIEDLEEWSAGTDSLVVSLTPFDILKVLEAIKQCEE